MSRSVSIAVFLTALALLIGCTPRKNPVPAEIVRLVSSAAETALSATGWQGSSWDLDDAKEFPETPFVSEAFAGWKSSDDSLRIAYFRDPETAMKLFFHLAGDKLFNAEQRGGAAHSPEESFAESLKLTDPERAALFSGRIMLLSGAYVLFTSVTANPEKLSDLLKKLKSPVEPAPYRYLPGNERYSQTWKYHDPDFLGTAALDNCASAEYRWAKKGIMFICELPSNAEALARLRKTAAEKSLGEPEERIIRRTSDNIMSRVIEIPRKTGKLRLFINQAGRFLFGIEAEMSSSLARAICNEVSQKLPVEEKVTLK